ncbi:hypothetical protein SAMN06297251_104159 [Fulvimarina manganoxydans]|uniref:Cell division protein FtsL n=1 Tax=Fulvimarina manganoxydans TaxID=937218 RepID=A0A1W2AG19_9HYPH|nr:hypothetical protein [Fulvimarina manganoxydans]MCK5932373.1 hypothetical protein [Fulvimarina manganoxydans]MEE2951720.1 hypothetical protein [Pseudomonadota bacterium]SMC59637.1 hypothetical protein SAMN06297251_104159 [Fulvimarina manganoxydans]
MFKTLEVVMIAVMLAAAGWTYKIKHEAEALENQLFAVERQIKSQKEAMAILSADLTLLVQPSRLQRLAEAYQAELQLEPLKPEQIIEPDELPAPAVAPVLDGAGESEDVASNTTAMVR